MRGVANCRIMPTVRCHGAKRLNRSGISQFLQSTLWCVGVFLILVCGGLIVTYVGEIIAGNPKYGVAHHLGLITFLAGLVFVGVKLVQVKLKEKRALRQIKEEQLILSRAKIDGGTLTISAAALECGIGIADTKSAFERLSQTGVCQIDVNEHGELYYRFPTFLNKQIESQIHPGEFS